LTNPAPKRVAIYARTSTVREQDPRVQIEELRRVAQQRGWAIVGEYVDHGYSGSRDKRPELDRLMVDVGKGRVDVVCCWRFDRFARSVRHLVTALDDFRARAIDFVSINDAIDTSTPAGRFTFHVIAAVAELEREIIRERVRIGIQSARRHGQRVGRPPRFVDVHRASMLRSEGKSLRQTALALKVGVATLHRALQAASTETVAAQ
jgi:DNA invertase Pin-like site-specific DNA recombinase